MNRNALCPTPPMGWNSWNTFTEIINEELILSTADTMLESGLLAAGYNYLVIDDCWSLKSGTVRDIQIFCLLPLYVSQILQETELLRASCFPVWSRVQSIRNCLPYPGSIP